MKDFIYNYVGTVDISEHINDLKSHNWEEWTYRQDTWQVHSQTKAVPIIADETYTNKGKKSKYYKYYENLLFNVNTILKKYYGNGKIIRIELVNLPANSKVERHYDTGESLIKDKRIHLVLETNDNVIFTVDTVEKNMKVGELWEINNSKYHSVKNDGSTDRFHLIIDYKITNIL